MGLVKIKRDYFHCVAAVNIRKDYKEAFNGHLGKLQRVTSLQLKLYAVLAVMPNRRIPVAVRIEHKEELNGLTRLGDVEPRKKSTLVLTRKKNGALRIYLDPMNLKHSCESTISCPFSRKSFMTWEMQWYSPRQTYNQDIAMSNSMKHVATWLRSKHVSVDTLGVDNLLT